MAQAHRAACGPQTAQFTDLPFEIVREIAGSGPSVLNALIRAYPAFARSLRLGDRLDFAENFGYNCQVDEDRYGRYIIWSYNGYAHRIGGPAKEYEDGSAEWINMGIHHRIGAPACISVDGYVSWYYYGKYHRLDGPARIWVDGSEEWYRYGKLHRVDGPALTNVSAGRKAWYNNGKLHRVGGPAFNEPDVEEWYIKGRCHRISAPAAIYRTGDVLYMWSRKGLLHRADGPAVGYADGRYEYWTNGVKNNFCGSLPNMPNFTNLPLEIAEKTAYNSLGVFSGKLRRICGPAVVFASGRIEWWIAGAKFSRGDLTCARDTRISRPYLRNESAQYFLD